MLPLRLRVMRHRKDLVSVDGVERPFWHPSAGFFLFHHATGDRLDDIDYILCKSKIDDGHCIRSTV